MALLFLALLCLAPSFTAGSAISIKYSNGSVDTNILLTTVVHSTFHVSYNFSMSTPKVPISVWNPVTSLFEDCEETDQFCLFDRILSDAIPVSLNSDSDAHSFNFNMEQANYDHLAIYKDECYQDFSTSCRYKNSTSGGKKIMVCMCNGINNFCTEEPIPMSKQGKCSDETIPTDLPVSSDFKLSVFFNDSSQDLTNVLLITRNDFASGDLVQFVFDVFIFGSQIININGQQCSPDCDPITIGINETVSITIQGKFTINLVQTAAKETQVIYGGCLGTVSGCRDSPPWITNYYGCLCAGNQTACDDPKPYHESCLGTTTLSTTLLPTSTITASTTSVSTSTTVKSTSSPLTSSATSSSTSLSTEKAEASSTTPRSTTETVTTATLTSEPSATTFTAETRATQLATTSRTDTTTETTTTAASFPSLKALSDSAIGPNNVTRILNETLAYSSKGESLTPDEIDDISTILSKSANVSGLNETDTTLILTNLDNTLSAPYGSFSEEAGAQLNGVFQSMVFDSESGNIEFLNGTNVDCSDPNQFHGLTDDKGGFDNQPTSPKVRLDTIQIALSVICSQLPPVTRVYFVIYRNRKTFVGPKRYRTYSNQVWEDNKDGRWSGPAVLNETDVPETPTPCDHQGSMVTNTSVMGATMLTENGSTLSQLSPGSAADLRYNIQGLLSPLHGKYVVTWWDTAAFVWANYDQCKTEKKGDMIQATCPHLTDFTLIVDGALNDPLECDEALSVTGYVVNGMSIASLSFLFIIYTCAFIPKGYSMTKRDSISLSYIISLLLFYIVFTIFADQKVAGDACSTVAAIAYALFLATILMSIFKCLRITDQFRPGRTRDCFQFFQRTVIVDTISIMVPFVVSLLLLVLTDFFNRNDTFCWIRVDYIVFATVIPVSILILNAILASILVIYKLCSTSIRVKKRGKRVDYQLGSKLANILILQFTLGTPWVLQFFTLGLPTATAWHYAFTIVIGSQGTILLLIFAYKKLRMIRKTHRERLMASVRTQTTRASYRT